jgi:DNA-binding CsgD family transcriptional regulator
MSYAALNLPGAGSGRPLLAMTYTPEWQKHYAQERYVDVDPVVKAGLGGILPVDWSEIDRSSPVVRKFFGEAQELKVGSQGLSIPVRGRSGEFALVSFTADVSNREWRLKHHELMRDAMVLAFNFHAAAMRSVQLANADTPALTHRESSCLRWKAQGKSDSEIATILSISPHTVRFHLECARTRLNAGNATHAVAVAISLGLISLACEPSSL